MIGFWIIVALLLTATVLLPYFPWSGHDAPERDALNMAFYHARLQEVRQENPADAGVMEVELQRTLLADIPDTPSQNARPLGRWYW